MTRKSVRRKNPTKEEVAAIEPDPVSDPELTLGNRLGALDGLKRAEIFHLHIPGDCQRYHEIINEKDRYMILESDATWDKEKGKVIGRSIFLLYVDRHAAPD